MDRGRRFIHMCLLSGLAAGLTYYILNGSDIFIKKPRLLLLAQGPSGQVPELFVDDGRGYFSPELKAVGTTADLVSQGYVLELPDVPLALRLRLDLGQEAAAWHIRGLVWSGPQYERTWTADTLFPRLQPLRDIEHLKLKNDSILVTTSGEDPALEILLPDLPGFWHFIRTPSAWNPPALLAALWVGLVTALWVHFFFEKLWFQNENLVWALLFAAFLGLPWCVMWGEPKLELTPAVRRENRRLAPLPRWEWDSLFTLPDRWTAYFEDHFGLKSFLAGWDARYKYSLLKSSPKPFEVAIGRGGWLFSRDTSLMRDFLHHEKMPASVMRRIRDNLEFLQLWLSRRGIRFFVFIAHNKHSIYPQYLPAALQHQGRPSIYEQWKQYMIDSSFVLPIDAGDELRQAAQHAEVFYPFDTHWNFHGGLLATRKLLFYLRRDFPQIPELHDSLFRWVPLDEKNADLARKIALQDVLHNREHQPSFRHNPSHPLPPPDFPHVPLLQPTLCYSVDNPALPRLLMYRDSFTNLMIPYLSACFSRSVFLWTHAIDPLSILQEKPDVVVLEIAEQHIRNLASIKTSVFQKYDAQPTQNP
ncbi:MAG: hypothetical protein N2050_04515 [Flavobacteriales bacterium]|nr:hypothetical protein [Flavobacteriales bacterium]